VGGLSLKRRLWFALYGLLELGAGHRAVGTSTPELGRLLGTSQQTASRQLSELEVLGFVARSASFRGVEVRITEQGMEELRAVYLRLKALIDGRIGPLIVEGTVFSGFGEGAYYLSQRGYLDQFERRLGFSPCPGTLNLRLSSGEVVKRRELETYPPILIRGFRRRGRHFGDVRCYPVIISGEVEGAVILINRTHYDDSVLEVIAPVHLRTKLGLRDGSRIKLQFPLM